MSKVTVWGQVNDAKVSFTPDVWEWTDEALIPLWENVLQRMRELELRGAITPGRCISKPSPAPMYVHESTIEQYESHGGESMCEPLIILGQGPRWEWVCSYSRGEGMQSGGLLKERVWGRCRPGGCWWGRKAVLWCWQQSTVMSWLFMHFGGVDTLASYQLATNSYVRKERVYSSVSGLSERLLGWRRSF